MSNLLLVPISGTGKRRWPQEFTITASMYFLYSLLLVSALVLGLPFWLWRLATQARYRAGLRARLGKVPANLAQAVKPGIWIHAVSVGEVLAVSRLVDEMRKRFPEHTIYVSTTTATGQELARQRWGEANVFFCPLDFNFAIRPYMARVRPELLVLAETEFWPNLLRNAHLAGAKIAVVNARISDRSYPRYRLSRAWWRRVLAPVDLFLAQSAKDCDRLLSIGATHDRAQVGGNLKFDISVTKEAAITQMLRKLLPTGTPVLVCGSTMVGEEELVLAAFGEVLEKYPKAVLILAPRRPERFDPVAAMAAYFAKERRCTFVRRSMLGSDAATPQRASILLLDTIGELASIYTLATVAFVGGSLVDTGGHSILEPAQFGLPIVVGPHTQNFSEIMAIFRGRGAVRETAVNDFAATLLQLLDNADARTRLGNAAREVFLSEAGATERTLGALEALLQKSTLGKHPDSIVPAIPPAIPKVQQ